MKTTPPFCSVHVSFVSCMLNQFQIFQDIVIDCHSYTLYQQCIIQRYMPCPQGNSGHVQYTLTSVHLNQFKHNVSYTGVKCESPYGCEQNFYRSLKQQTKVCLPTKNTRSIIAYTVHCICVCGAKVTCCNPALRSKEGKNKLISSNQMGTCTRCYFPTMWYSAKLFKLTL